jgi:hypothetical protein
MSPPIIQILITIAAIISWIMWEPNPKAKESKLPAPKHGDFRISKDLERGQFQVEKYYDYPGWHDFGGPKSSLEEAQAVIRAVNGPFREVVE